MTNPKDSNELHGYPEAAKNLSQEISDEHQEEPPGHLSEEFVKNQNAKLAPMGLQLNSLLSHPQCTEEKCYCGRKPCYYSPLWEK